MRIPALTLGLLVAGYFAGCGGSGDNSGTSPGKGGTGTGASGGSAGVSNGGSGGTGNTSGTGGSGAGGGSGGVGNSSGTGGGGGTGNATGGGPGDAGLPDVTFTYDGPIEDDSGTVVDACAGTTVSAEPAPFDMYVMLDNSGSMGADCAIGSSTNSKWCYAINSLSQFFSVAPAATGVALQYFPLCFSGSCAGATCGTAAVALGNLPGNLAALQASLNGVAPNGGTPMEAALNGITQFTSANKQPGRVMIGVLITDGDPDSSCTQNSNTLANIVGTHYANTGIKTFVIGMTGAVYSTLDAIAAPGGASSHSTNCAGAATSCFYYDVGNGSPAAFNSVLLAIQKSAVSCQFSMPNSDAGLVDPTKVNVEYLVGGQPPALKLSKVTNSGQCGGAGGWYYDNNTTPTTITLCPSTCSVVQTDALAKINVALGCLGS